MSEVITDVTAWYMDHMNYIAIFLLMTIENSFIPFPSEIVVPPAAYKAAQGDLNLSLVIVFSTLGALSGALVNYYLSLWIGRSAVYSFSRTKIAHFLMIEPTSVKKAE